MRLTDPKLDATFYGNVRKSDEGRDAITKLPNIEGAQGLLMICPCGEGHSIMIPFANPRNAPDVPCDHGPRNKSKTGFPRWNMNGSGLEDLTLTPSIDVGNNSCWHGFITSGEVK